MNGWTSDWWNWWKFEWKIDGLFSHRLSPSSSCDNSVCPASSRIRIASISSLPNCRSSRVSLSDWCSAQEWLAGSVADVGRRWESGKKQALMHQLRKQLLSQLRLCSCERDEEDDVYGGGIAMKYVRRSDCNDKLICTWMRRICSSWPTGSHCLPLPFSVALALGIMYACMHVCMIVCVYMRVRMYEYVCVCMFLYASNEYEYVCVCMCAACMCACMHVCIYYACMHVYMRHLPLTSRELQ